MDNWFGDLFIYNHCMVDGYRGHEEIIYLDVTYDTHYHYSHAVMNPRDGCVYFYLEDGDVDAEFRIDLTRRR